MIEGTIRKLKETFGFIRGTDNIDYFFHAGSLQKTPGVQFQQLREGLNVRFEPYEGEKGPRACDVLVLDRV